MTETLRRIIAVLLAAGMAADPGAGYAALSRPDALMKGSTSFSVLRAESKNIVEGQALAASCAAAFPVGEVSSRIYKGAALALLIWGVYHPGLTSHHHFQGAMLLGMKIWMGSLRARKDEGSDAGISGWSSGEEEKFAIDLLNGASTTEEMKQIGLSPAQAKWVLYEKKHNHGPFPIWENFRSRVGSRTSNDIQAKLHILWSSPERKSILDRLQRLKTGHSTMVSLLNTGSEEELIMAGLSEAQALRMTGERKPGARLRDWAEVKTRWGYHAASQVERRLRSWLAWQEQDAWYGRLLGHFLQGDEHIGELQRAGGETRRRYEDDLQILSASIEAMIRAAHFPKGTSATDVLRQSAVALAELIANHISPWEGTQAFLWGLYQDAHYRHVSKGQVSFELTPELMIARQVAAALDRHPFYFIKGEPDSRLGEIYRARAEAIMRSVWIGPDVWTFSAECLTNMGPPCLKNFFIARDGMYRRYGDRNRQAEKGELLLVETPPSNLDESKAFAFGGTSPAEQSSELTQALFSGTPLEGVVRFETREPQTPVDIKGSLWIETYLAPSFAMRLIGSVIYGPKIILKDDTIRNRYGTALLDAIYTFAVRRGARRADIELLYDRTGKFLKKYFASRGATTSIEEGDPHNESEILVADLSNFHVPTTSNQTPIKLKRPVNTGLRISTSDLIGLKIREGRGEENAVRPPMYQTFTEKDLLLFATLPLEKTAVCLPRILFAQTEYDRDGNFISQIGFQDFYVRYEWNGERYSAAGVIWKNQSYSLSDFREWAGQQVKEQLQSLKANGLAYAYFAPQWTEWRTVVESGGYIPVLERWKDLHTALDPSLLAKKETGEKTAGLIYRVPLYHAPAGSEINLDYFAPVQILIGHDPQRDDSWASFEEYQDSRQKLNITPEPIRQAMIHWLNAFHGGLDLVFPVGALFGDVLEFWPNYDARVKAHEGIDVYEGLDRRAGKFIDADQDTPARAIYRGRVARIKLFGKTAGDLMGITVVIAHDFWNATGPYQFITHLTHLFESAVRVKIGEVVEEGQDIATLNEGLKRINRHVHVGMAWIGIPLEQLSWDTLNPYFAKVHLVNPLNGIPLEPGVDARGRPALIFRASGYAVRAEQTAA